jgi:hypothetical protein
MVVDTPEAANVPNIFATGLFSERKIPVCVVEA